MLRLYCSSTNSPLSVEMGEGWMQSALVHVLVLLSIRAGICWDSEEGHIFMVCQCPSNEHRVGY